MPEIEAENDIRCVNHPGVAATGNCNVCGNPICIDCRKEFGYYCSQECLDHSVSTVDHEAKAQREKEMEATHRIARVVKTFFLLLFMVFLGVMGWYCWKWFLDPGGKMAWQWKHDINAENFDFFPSDSSTVIFKNGSNITALNSRTGKEISNTQNHELGGYTNLIKSNSYGSILAGKDIVARIGKDGKLKWVQRFENPILRCDVGPHLLILAIGVRDNKKEDEEEKFFFRYKYTKLVPIALSDGKILAEKRLKKKEMFSYRMSVGEKAFAYVYSKTLKDKYVSYIKVISIRSGKEKWQVKLNSSLMGGPDIVRDSLIFQTQNKISAVSINGRKKLWELDLKSSYFGSGYKIYDDYLIVSQLGGFMQCVDLKQHEVLWKERAPVSANSTIFAGGKLYLQGYEEKETDNNDSATVKLPKRYDQLKDMDLLKNITKCSIKRKKYTGILICLDCATGKELWRKQQIRGEIVANDKKLVVVTDTSLTSRMGLSNKGKGFNIIQQFNPDTGSELFYRKNTYGFSAPYIIAGDKIIGIEYERISSGMYGLSAGKTNYFGIAAFNLK